MAPTAEIKVLASMAIKEAYVELVPEFERASGHRVATTWSGTVDMLRRLSGGETADLVIMSGAAIDELIALGRIVPGSRVDLVKSAIGVAVRAGAQRPDIRTAESVTRALLSAKSVAYSTGPSGVHLAELFERIGIAGALAPKLRVVRGEPVGAVIARGEAEIGFQQVSELLPVAGIDYLGPLPEGLQRITVFSAGLHAGAREPEAARALVGFLTAPAAAPMISKKGMQPA